MAGRDSDAAKCRVPAGDSEEVPESSQRDGAKRLRALHALPRAGAHRKHIPHQLLQRQV